MKLLRVFVDFDNGVNRSGIIIVRSSLDASCSRKCSDIPYAVASVK